MNRKLLGFVIVVVLVTSGILLLPRPAAAQEPAFGPMADEIRYIEIASADVAVEDLNAGGHDIRQFSIPGATTRARVLQMANAKPALGAGNFWNMMVNGVPRADGKLNPFALQPVRESMNWLIDREFILNEVYFGYGIPHTALFYAMEPEYARHAAFIAGVEAQYGYTPTKAHDTITAAMIAAGATLVSGKWQHGGSPVTINFIIRVDDPRRTNWGNYVAGLLETEGFTVTRDYKSSALASPIVYAGDATDGQWQAYTEGWGSSGLTLWDSIRGYQMFRWDAYSTQWAPTGPREVDATTAKAIDDWYLANYTTEDQRNQFIRTAITGTIKDSTRIWLVAEQTFYVERTDIDAVHDLAAVHDALLPIRTARRNNAVGGTLTVSQPTGWVGGWNPIGITWAYDANIRNNWRDYGVYPHPHTGKYIPIRGNFDVTSAAPGTSFDMPNDAIRWNNVTDAWETVAATATAKSNVTFTYSFGKWHHGEPMNMYDILNAVSVAYRLANPFEDGYSAAHEGDFALFLSAFKGLRVVGNPATSNQVSVYVDYWHVDPAEIAAVADLWTPAPYEVWEVLIQAFKSAPAPGIWFKESDSKRTAGIWMNQGFGPSIARLDAALATLVTGPTVPVGLVGYVNPAAAATRYAALQTWRTAHSNFLVSNGPFYLDTVDEATKTTILKADRTGYPLAPRTWDALLRPRIPEVTLGPAPTINIDVPAGVEFSIQVRLFGEPFDDATLAFIVLDPGQGRVLFSGVPVRVNPGEYEARLTANQTSTMTPGAYELRVIGTSPDAAVPAIVKRSFLAFTVKGVLEELIKATEQALKDDIGNLRSRVDTIDQSTNTLTSDVAGVSTLVTVVLALSVIAIVSSVVSMLILLRRLPPRLAIPESTKERPPEEM